MPKKNIPDKTRLPEKKGGLKEDVLRFGFIPHYPADLIGNKLN